MNKLHVTGRVKEINAGARTLTAYASTRDVDRDGEVILPEAWRMTVQEFPSVPLLWAHDYRVLPVGKALNFEIDELGLKFTAQFATTEFANDVWKLYQDGFLNSFSVGFKPTKWHDGDEPGQPQRTFLEAELLEISAIPIPANPFARVERAVPVITMKSLDSFTTKQDPDNPSPVAVADAPDAESVDDIEADLTGGLDIADHADEPEAQEDAQRQTPEATAATVAADADDDLTPEDEAALADMLAGMLAHVVTYLQETDR